MNEADWNTTRPLPPISKAVGLPGRSRRAGGAFTLIELLVVVAVLAVLAVTLVPALCRIGPRSRVAACTANFRQWAVSANLYAKDNRDFLPSFDTAGGGLYVWDVGTNMCDALGQYDVTVPLWFCPVRPQELDTANQWAVVQYSHALSNVQELREYFRRNSPQLLALNHNYWVPRTQSTTSYPQDFGGIFPPLVGSWLLAAPSTRLGWPKTTSDKSVSSVPFVSDKCASGSGNGLISPPAGVGYGVENISPNTAHFSNSQFSSVNAAYVDGRVESHGPNKIVPASARSSVFWFY